MTTAYATRAQLLERCNLVRLAQLAVPTGFAMPEVTDVRAALLGDTGLSVDTATAAVLAEAVLAVDTALADAADLMRSYAVPEPAATVPPVLVRINCQLAMQYLAERAGMLADSDSAAYNATLKLLAKHASGEVALVPPVAPAPGELPSDGVARITSSPSRYGAGAADDQEWM